MAEVISLISQGRMALPEFQRNFVWEPNHVVELLDSVSNGWPVGSLLVLNGPQPFEVKQINDGPVVSRDTTRHYLLDGQQRVTSLFHAFTGKGEYAYYLDVNSWLDSAQDTPPEIRWKLSQKTDKFSTGQYPITDFLNHDRFEFLLQSLDTKTQRSMRSLRSQRFGALIEGDYQLPAIVMASNIELEAMARIFETLNRTGVQLNAFDLMVAVLYPHDFNLRAELEQAVESFPRLGESKFKVDGIELLKLIALWQRQEDTTSSSRPRSRRVTGVRQRDVLNIPAETVKGQWNRAVEAYDAALGFMESEAGVFSAAEVPSDGMLLTLSYFLDSQQKQVAQPPRDAVRRWYWGAIALQTYAQGANTRVLTDIDDLVFPDTDQVISSLLTGVEDLARRNKILRLGMAGLVRMRGGLDLVSGQALQSTPKDFSILQLNEMTIRRMADERIRDIALVSAAGWADLRKALRKEAHSARDKVSHEALVSQGFEVASDGWPISSDRRAQLFASWLGEKL